ncbi:hypothetical protein BRAS3843_1080025 [Bradyrhizobium sp. STM 3843]|nr:hypothetical protein BRAS3843_1080025 [Bradyrhizobium sp. STM 3843]
MSTAQWTWGGQLDASSTSGVMSALRNICWPPSRTRVAAISSRGAAALCSASKLMDPASRSRSGSRSRGLKRPARRCGPNETEALAGEKPPSSMTERNEASLVMRFQNCASSWRAPSRPPSARPLASSAALIAPALAPLIVSKSQAGSSNRRSSTPQAKADNVPPPCSASESLRGGQTRGAGGSCGVAMVSASDFSGAAAGFTSVTAGVSIAAGLGSAAVAGFAPVAKIISATTVVSGCDGFTTGGALTVTAGSVTCGAAVVVSSVDQICAAERSALALERMGAACCGTGSCWIGSSCDEPPELLLRNHMESEWQALLIPTSVSRDLGTGTTASVAALPRQIRPKVARFP